MTKSVLTTNKARKQYTTPEFRNQALKLAKHIGVASVAFMSTSATTGAQTMR